jgi:hypothetical protein
MERTDLSVSPLPCAVSALQADLMDLGWDNPNGGLWASPQDIAALISLMFRVEDPADGGQQLLDGHTLREMLTA